MSPDADLWSNAAITFICLWLAAMGALWIVYTGNVAYRKRIKAVEKERDNLERSSRYSTTEYGDYFSGRGLAGMSQQASQAKLDAIQRERDAAVEKWNVLVRKINSLGGNAFLDGTEIKDLRRKVAALRSIIDEKGSSQFTDAELRTLVTLVHPDKHGGSDKATAMTQKINGMRK